MDYAIVTGAARGIGKAIAVELGKRKINLLLVDLDSEFLQQTVTEIKNEFGVSVDHLTTDLSEINAAVKVFDWCKENQYNVNILVNNAAYGLAGPFEKYSFEEHRNLIQLNILTYVQLCYLFIPLLKQQSKSYILNICSTSAYHAVPFLGTYSASKAFMLSFTRALAQELKNTSISVSAVSPGPTDTDFANRANMNERTKKIANRFYMSPQAVAKNAVKAMFSCKREMIPGFINKLTIFLTWLAPKRLTERTAENIYKEIG
jgi:short-subunit dehydrogenase